MHTRFGHARLVEVRPVAVVIDAAGAIFVDQAVRIVINSFAHELVDAAFALAAVGLLHQAGLVRVDHPLAVWIANAHYADKSVAV